mgnify:CR=1 FL=1
MGRGTLRAGPRHQARCLTCHGAHGEVATSESLSFEVELDRGFDAAVAATREALKAEGFGMLTEIDLRAVF